MIARDAAAVVAAFGLYRGRVVPSVRRQLGAWRAVAATIPDPVLRRQALAALDEKGLNVEATAVFATLAPRRTRAAALRAMVALQVAVDYLDTLGERAEEEPLRDGLQLHRALAAAVTPGAAGENWYRLHPRGEDGGYLDRLVAACQEAVASLPAAAVAAPVARRAASRCGAGQSHTHAAELGGAAALHGRGTELGSRGPTGDGAPADEGLRAWASGLGAPGVYRWWEVAAGASSSVAAHALIAAAADPRTDRAEAEAIDAVYFPAVGALTVLLDDLIDREEDAATGSHSYVAHYRDGEEAADRLALIAHLARAGTARLRHRDRHAAILAGVVGFYLSAPAASAPYARPSRERLFAAAGPAVRPIVAVMRRRRRA